MADAEVKDRGGWETDAAFYAYLQSCIRLERRFSYSSPLVAFADFIESGSVVGEELCAHCIRDHLDDWHVFVILRVLVAQYKHSPMQRPPCACLSSARNGTCNFSL